MANEAKRGIILGVILSVVTVSVALLLELFI